jgi:hypothetical protein
MEEFKLLRSNITFWVKEEKEGIEVRIIIFVEI